MNLVEDVGVIGVLLGLDECLGVVLFGVVGVVVTHWLIDFWPGTKLANLLPL